MFRLLKTFYSFLFRYKWRLFAFLVIITISSILQSVQPYFYKLFVDALGTQKLNQLTQILVAFIFVRLFGLIFETISHTLADSVVLPASRDARVAVFKKIQDLDFAYHLSKSTGSLISAFKRGDSAFFNLADSINGSLYPIFISFIVILSFFAQINWQLVAILFISLLINLIAARFLIQNNMFARASFNRSEDEINEIIVDNLMNFETVKLFAREKYELTHLQDRFKPWLAKFWAYGNTFRLVDIVVGLTGNAGLFVVLFFGLYQLDLGLITIGQYVMILGFVTNFYPKFFQLIFELRNIAKHYTDMERYFAILDESTLVKDPQKPLENLSVNGDIEFTNLSFAYPGNKKGAVSKINLSVKAGQSVAFVGRSGVGKTTLVKLLMRFYDPTKGQILLDGHNIKDFTKQQLRSFMGVVPQEPILFNNTIGYNIGYGVDDPTSEQIIAAAKMANLHEFIDDLPKKYETHVGERGVKLSGGQKQRLAIARMILSNPDIIIFDEATSQLDSESEKLIQDAFWKAAEGKTTFIIAHRLSTITRAEKIIVMEHGQIAEIGSHHQLLTKKDSLYSRFWSLQTNKP